MNKKLKLVGQTITLELPKRADYDVLGKFFRDAKTMAQVDVYNNPNDVELEQIWQEHNKRNQESTSFRFIIHLNTSNKIIGCCGFGLLDLANGYADYGIILDHHWWHLGIAIECLFLCYDYGFAKLKLNNIVFSTKKGRGARIVEKVGFKLQEYHAKIKIGNNEFTNVCQYSCSTEDWPMIKKKIQA